MAVKAPTPPTKPVPPSMDSSNTIPEASMESSGPSVPAGEIHTPAEKFGIHIRIAGSEAVTVGDEDGETVQEEASTGKNQAIQSKEKNIDNLKANTKPKDDGSLPPQAAQAIQQAIGNGEVPLMGEGSEEKTTEGSLKISPQDDSWLDDYTGGGHISYWPFILVFVVALVSFLLMSQMKKRKQDDFGSLSYKKVEEKVTKDITEESTVSVSGTELSSKKKKEDKPRFEIRI